MYTPSSAFIDSTAFSVLVSIYFGSIDDRAWIYVEREQVPQSGILSDLQRHGLIEIVFRTAQHIFSDRIGKVKFAATAAGEKVIRQAFLSDPNGVIKACQSGLRMVPVTITDVLRADVSQLPEFLASEHPIVSDTASLVLSWRQEAAR